MKRNWKRICFSAPFLSLVSLATTAVGAEKAKTAESFVESIGVCTHWTYSDTPYGFAYEKVRAKLVELGIRHVRDGLNPRIPELAKQGIRTMIVAEPEFGTPEQIRDKVKAINAQLFAIDAVEGPNEPDLFWMSNKKSYKGQGYEGGEASIINAVIAYQKDLYSAFKSDPATARITLVGSALGKTYEPGKNPFPKGALAKFVDWGNFHPYPGGNPFSIPFGYGTIEKYYWDGTQPSGNLDEFPYAFQTYQPTFAPKPMASSETGYSTDLNGTSEAAHAKYIPRLFAEYFRLGIQRTYSYELVDEFEDKLGTNREAHFGLLRRDVTPKPAYTALKNLIALLNDKGATPQFRPSSLDYKLDVRPAPGYDRTQFVHHLLLQKSDGDFYLVVWHEIANEDKSVQPRRQITPPDMPATLTLTTPIRSAVFYQPNDSAKPLRTVVNPQKLELKIPDRLLILKLTPETAKGGTP